MRNNQKRTLITFSWFMAVIIIFLSIGSFMAEQPKQPVESDRRVILTCTVKSNIDGVITLNDECDLTAIGEVRK